MATSSVFAPAPARGLAGPGTVLHRLRLRWQRARARRREIAQITLELQAYTDRQLHDLGMSRGDIPDVARGVFRAG